MKRSKHVNTTILSAIATTLLVHCDELITNDQSGEEVKHCVDETDTVVEEGKCDLSSTADSGISETGSDAGTVHTPRFRWYYGGTRIYSSGTKVSGGTYEPAPSKSYSPPSTITRGGFGSTGKSVGGGSFGGGSGE